MENEVILGDIPVTDASSDPTLGQDVTLTQTDEIVPPVDPVVTDPAVSNPITPVVPENTTDFGVGQFFGTLQESVTIAWTFHLKTRKHSAHLALHEYYEKALDIVDDIIEQYQGINGVCEEMFVNTILCSGIDEVTYFNELKTFINEKKDVLNLPSEILSTIDDLLGLIDSTIYKLTAFCEHKVKSFDEFCFEDLNESCSYDQFGNRSCDDPNDDYDPDFGEEEEE